MEPRKTSKKNKNNWFYSMKTLAKIWVNEQKSDILYVMNSAAWWAKRMDENLLKVQ